MAPSQLQLSSFLSSDNHSGQLLQNCCVKAVPIPLVNSRQTISSTRHCQQTLLLSYLLSSLPHPSDKTINSRITTISCLLRYQKSSNPHLHCRQSGKAKMRHRQTKRARQYALPGCCFDKPIVVDDDDEQTTATKPRNIPISAHTATWLEAKARGRWSASATTTAESTSSNTVTRVEEEAEDGWRGSVSRPAVQAEKSQRCRVSSILTRYDVS